MTNRLLGALDPDAPSFHFDLTVPSDGRKPLAMAWLALGLLALLASGLFSVLLVLSRTPQLQTLFPVADFFRVALVVHVDLSVLVWFLAFGGALWTLSGTTRLQFLAWCAFVLSASGTATLCVAPFIDPATPVMANYVPVLDGPVFLGGLMLFGAGITLLCLRSMLAASPVGVRISGDGALRFGLNAAMVTTAVAVFAFGWSWVTVPRDLDARAYYELLFWGGGHVLQFAYTLLMLIGWLWLASSLSPSLRMSPRVVTLLFAMALIAVFLTPITTTHYAIGLSLTLKAFAAAILGGLGNFRGAVLGGCVIGVVESLTAGLISSHFKDVITFLFILILLVALPRGLLHSLVEERERV